MRLRSWWFFAFWVTAGVVGFTWLLPDWLPDRWAGFGSADRATFESVATALPEEDFEPNSASASAHEHSQLTAPPPVVLKEVSPSDLATGLEAFGSSVENGNAGAWSGDWADETIAHEDDGFGDSSGAASGGFGMTGHGIGGGGTGTGSIGYGSLGTIGKGSGTGAAPPRPPLPQMAAPTSAATLQTTEPTEDDSSNSELPDMIGALNDDATPTAAADSHSRVDETSPPGAEFDDILDEIDRKLAGLPLGHIAFNAPETIPLGEMAAIELLVSLAETEEQLREAVRAPGPIESASVHVSPYMEAQLNGVGFRIESATPARQLLSRNERTRWRWQIEPTKADTLELTLTLSALFSVDGQERTKAIRTFEKTIVVDVPITHRFAQFIGSNQEWLATALIIPVLGAVYRMFRRKRRPKSIEASEMDRRAA